MDVIENIPELRDLIEVQDSRLEQKPGTQDIV